MQVKIENKNKDILFFRYYFMCFDALSFKPFKKMIFKSFLDNINDEFFHILGHVITSSTHSMTNRLSLGLIYFMLDL